MKYSIIIEKPAAKFIERLPKNEKSRILRAISKLPFEGDIKKLQGNYNNEMYRLRVGGYRIIYCVDNGNLIVFVVDAGNRGQIYRNY